MLQLRAAHIKLPIAICVIGHFQEIRMCSVRVLWSPVLAWGKLPEPQCDLTDGDTSVHQCHTVRAMTSAAAQRCLPLSPVGPPLSQSVSQSVLSVTSSCQPANDQPVPIQTD